MDVGAERVEALGEVLVAAVDGVNVSESGSAGGGEHGDEEHDCGAKSGGTDEISWLESGGAVDENAMGIGEFDVDI